MSKYVTYEFLSLDNKNLNGSFCCPGAKLES